ncbi:MAG: tRNA uridine-5-carboxymethylaminomethyl(34) synthesis GTPase MnmE [Pelagimonas sp.]|jgi:tRNA modification GTPase|nr:tRNA uridine-5-carboxymethylaminomethyl(34) synthesis GTPase MnmE [Pelagimonas sp.]
MDTIFAQATSPGKSGVAVIRISGAQALDAAQKIAGDLPAPRQSGLRNLRDRSGKILDQALVLVFEEGHSFTGEKVVEFQIHGSIAVMSAVLSLLGDMPGLRGAEAGEFTRRAMENGKLDLTQVEALADLIEAETESQRRLAQDVFSGALGQLVQDWRKQIIRAAALLEATIDFADEEVPVDVTGEVQDLITQVRQGIDQQISGFGAAERVRIGFEVAIVGPPNAGKSTLLNYLAGREAAITSDIAGTTRDVIELRMNVHGLAVTFLDTAGLRDTDDRIEAIGVARARDRAERADLRIHLRANAEDPLLVAAGPDDLVLLGKDDTGAAGGVSGQTGQGVANLLDHINHVLQGRVVSSGLASRERHKIAFEKGRGHIDQALSLLQSGPDLYDIAAEEIRIAIYALESLLGFVDVEHLLDEIFSSFCVGK